jgi:hypothetical protein
MEEMCKYVEPEQAWYEVKKKYITLTLSYALHIPMKTHWSKFVSHEACKKKRNLSLYLIN